MREVTYNEALEAFQNGEDVWVDCDPYNDSSWETDEDTGEDVLLKTVIGISQGDEEADLECRDTYYLPI